MLEWIESVNAAVNRIVWGPPFMLLLVGTGFYLTIRLGFFQFAYPRLIWRETVGRLLSRTASDPDEQGSITPFQAVASAMAATIGVGNIAGVATAIALGGPGAVFWMWMVALVGMATKFCEASLGHRFRKIDTDGHISGGVFYYIENGLGPKWKPLAMVYALFAGIAAFGIGNMVQANTLAHSLDTAFSIPPWVSGFAAAVLVGMVTLGGIRRIAKTAERVVPIMAVAYVIGALAILATHLPAIPAAFGSIFHHAVAPASAAGGFAGAAVAEAIRYGIARGIFSNEAGLGSASIVYAQSKNNPFRQGMWGIWEVFVDTIVICTMTALVILVTGAVETGETGAALASAAFSEGLAGTGGLFVLFALVIFSYTTMLTWNFYGEKSWEYLLKVKGRRLIPYRLLFLAFIPVGAVGGLELIWSIADTLNGFMAAPNLLALLLLGGVAAKLKRDSIRSR